MHVRKEAFRIGSRRRQRIPTPVVIKICLLLVGLLGFAPAFAEPSAFQDDIVAAEANGRVMHLHARTVATVREAMKDDRQMRRDRRVAGETPKGATALLG